MNNYKYLLKNTGMLMMSNVITKIVTFLLLPLYTNVLTTSEYGIYDVFQTSIYILFPVLTICIQDSLLRYCTEYKEMSNSIFKYGIKVLFISTSFILGCLVLNSLLCLNETLSEYWYWFISLYFFYGFSSIIDSFARSNDKIKDISISLVIYSVVTIVCNIIFLLLLGFGLKGYFLSTIIGRIVSTTFLSIRINIYKLIGTTNISDNIKHKLFSYGMPLVLNAIGGWINNASDRYIIIWISGIAANGIYSIAYKVSAILETINASFYSVWVLSSIKEYNSEDTNNIFSTSYSLYSMIMIIFSSIIIVFTKTISSILFSNDFFKAWIYVPFLVMSVVFFSSSSFLAGIYIAAKKTKVLAQSTIIAAIINLILNIILVYRIGPIGAAIATYISSITIWTIRQFKIKTVINWNIRLVRDVLTYFLLLIQTIILYFVNGAVFYFVESILTCFVIYLFRKEISISMRKTKLLFLEVTNKYF